MDDPAVASRNPPPRLSRLTMLPLHTHLSHEGPVSAEILKVVTPEEQTVLHWDRSRCALWDPDGIRDPAAAGSGWGAWITPGDRPQPPSWPGLWINRIRQPWVIASGDVIRIRPDGGQASVLFRRGANANALFATERCNSFCLMCSQPPRDTDDAWRVDEMLTLIPLIDRDEVVLGITGGEPTLLDEGLWRVMAACREHLPGTALHILSNGRRFADPDFTAAMAAVGHPAITWAVPLYADVPELHDHVVQARSAFDETLRGLHELARWRAQIEIRVVLHRLTVPRLGPLARFIYRTLPFVDHVAFMGLEPMGFAKVNAAELAIDPLDYVDVLAEACFHLANRGMAVSIYNLPLCVLPESLRPFARRSISDWKNVYAPECEGCALRQGCAGFFASAGPAWRSRGIRPVEQRLEAV